MATARMNQPKAASVYNVDSVTTLVAQVAALSKKIDAMGTQPIQQVVVIYELCAGNHPSNQCAIS